MIGTWSIPIPAGTSVLESLTEADLVFFVPNLDTILIFVEVALSGTYKEYTVDHDRRFRFDQASFVALANPNLTEEFHVMFHHKHTELAQPRTQRNHLESPTLRQKRRKQFYKVSMSD